MSRCLLSLSFVVVVLLPLPLPGGDRPDFNGTWELKTGKSELSSSKGASLTWVVVQDEARIRISETALHPDGKETRTAITCTTDGKECSTDGKNQPDRVSFWYNGTTLVEMDFNGRNRESVVKKRIKLNADGSQMLVELTPILGSGESGSLVFQKR